MRLHNLKHPEETVDFRQAVIQGLGRDRGLFFPECLDRMENIPALLDLPFVPRSARILKHLIGDELSLDDLTTMVQRAFDFPLAVEPVTENISTLELFHGPTLAFKDFGARFMAQCLAAFNDKDEVTILTATSGDTGAAVAHAFYRLPGIRVKILYPKGKISPLQEKLFCSLGHNIETIAIEGDFDDCQRLVKSAFAHEGIRQQLNLTSANSINIARLLAQVTYYFEAAARHRAGNLVVSVPSGNFGNLTAGLMARALGAPIKRFVAATNVNDTVPRYLLNHHWQPRPTVATDSNAMDVAEPNNWPRIMALFGNDLNAVKAVVHGCAFSDTETRAAMRELDTQDYVSEPHGAVAYCGLKDTLADNEHGLFLGTAHPAKFMQTVESVLSRPLPFPPALERVRNAPVLSRTMTNDTRDFLRHLLG